MRGTNLNKCADVRGDRNCPCGGGCQSCWAKVSVKNRDRVFDNAFEKQMRKEKKAERECVCACKIKQTGLRRKKKKKKGNDQAKEQATTLCLPHCLPPPRQTRQKKVRLSKRVVREGQKAEVKQSAYLFGTSYTVWRRKTRFVGTELNPDSLSSSLLVFWSRCRPIWK